MNIGKPQKVWEVELDDVEAPPKEAPQTTPAPAPKTPEPEKVPA